MANPQNLPPEIADALARGNMIEAIKLVRQQQKGLGLAEAKGLVEALQRQGNVKVNVTTTMRAARKPAGLSPGFEQHAGLSPGEVPRGAGLQAVGAIVIAVVIAVIAAVWLLKPG